MVLIKKLIEQGNFKAVIDREYPFEQIVEAYRYVETGQKTGHVVITVEHDNWTAKPPIYEDKCLLKADVLLFLLYGLHKH